MTRPQELRQENRAPSASGDDTGAAGPPTLETGRAAVQRTVGHGWGIWVWLAKPGFHGWIPGNSRKNRNRNLNLNEMCSLDLWLGFRLCLLFRSVIVLTQKYGLYLKENKTQIILKPHMSDHGFKTLM